MNRSHALVGLIVTMAAVASACSSDTDGDVGQVPAVTEGESFPAARCEANEAAGTVTYLSGFDFAAAASIIDVVVAETAGYYDELCLDVEVRPGTGPTANYPLVAAGTAQFASGGSFAEVVAFALANDTNFVVTSVEGRVPIDTLITKDVTSTLQDLRGATIGVKAKLPTSIDVMLRQAGLVDGEDFDTVLLDGYDPLAHFEIDQIDAMPGWKSNEPGALRRAGVEFGLIDPVDAGVPGSFGVIFANADFVADHPTAAEDFVRATMRGLADALADPDAAANTAIELLNSTGNASFLSLEGEAFRWQTEAGLIAGSTPDSTGVGVPDPVTLQAELDAAAATGLFGEGTSPRADATLRNDIIAAVYGSGTTVIWPSGS